MFSARNPYLLRGAVVSLLACAASAQCGGDQPATTILDYVPTQSEVVLNTDFTQIQPSNGPPINVSNGVFRFRDVVIPEGVTVRGVGSRPMVWIVSGSFVVNGALRVDGSDGRRVNTLNGANFPTPGGEGGCAGGAGGKGSPETTKQSSAGETGYGFGQVPFVGGRGGALGIRFGCGRGSGGGGGTFATFGDPHYKQKNVAGSTGFIQQTGIGGYGCNGNSGSASRTLPGGMPGLALFSDGRGDNNFYGVAKNYQTGELIRGELPFPIGGQGGGGGGDLAGAFGGNFISNNKGGGGGGGGGALIICARHIEVGPRGIISANGGNGGGGEQAGGNNQGGGGAGGSGGMIVLVARDDIVLYTHGLQYKWGDPGSPQSAMANGSYDFSLSADGGVGTQGSFGGVSWSGKYPPPVDGEMWDRNPSGGFGGMGVIQMITRPGDNADGTNTVLDDHIHIVQQTAAGDIQLTGEAKESYIAWRGYPNEQGVWVDDFNRPTYNNDPTMVSSYPSWAVPFPTFPSHVEGRDSEGDIRPAPILMPLSPGAR